MNKQSYRKYLKTRHWRRVKERYYNTFEYKCCVTGCPVRKGLELHHLTYQRVGKERLTDLVYCCANHHRLISEGSIEFERVTYCYPKGRKVVEL